MLTGIDDERELSTSSCGLDVTDGLRILRQGVATRGNSTCACPLENPAVPGQASRFARPRT
jgi:hypothetical protein